MVPEPMTQPEHFVKDRPLLERGASERMGKDAEKLGGEVRGRLITRLDSILQKVDHLFGLPQAVSGEIDRQAAKVYEVGSARINNALTVLANFGERTATEVFAKIGHSAAGVVEFGASVAVKQEEKFKKSTLNKAADLVEDAARPILAAEVAKARALPQLVEILEGRAAERLDKAAELAKRAQEMNACRGALASVKEFRNRAMEVAEQMHNPDEAAAFFHFRKLDRFAKSSFGTSYADLDESKRKIADETVARFEGLNTR